MANILTAGEAANVLRCDDDDALMLQLLPLVDAYVERATGRDWTADNPINPLAKSAAQMLITMWHENPAMMGSEGALAFGMMGMLTQLEAQAIILEMDGIPESDLELLFINPADGTVTAATSIRPLLVFSHEMAAAVTTQVALQTTAGAGVTTTNTLDVTLKRVTMTPTSALSALTDYKIVLTAAEDIYGRTLTTVAYFRTA